MCNAACGSRLKFSPANDTACHRCRELQVGLRQRPRHPIGCLEPGCLDPDPGLATAILAHPILGRSSTWNCRTSQAGRHKPKTLFHSETRLMRETGIRSDSLGFCTEHIHRFSLSQPLRHAFNSQLATGEAWGQRGLATESQAPWWHARHRRDQTCSTTNSPNLSPVFWG